MGASEGASACTCERCGIALASGECPSCGWQPHARLRRLPPLRTPLLPAEAERIRLVREYKGPTVRDLLAAPDAATEVLPGSLRACARAIAAGDVARADGQLGEA